VRTTTRMVGSAEIVVTNDSRESMNTNDMRL